MNTTTPSSAGGAGYRDSHGNVMNEMTVPAPQVDTTPLSNTGEMLEKVKKWTDKSIVRTTLKLALEEDTERFELEEVLVEIAESFIALSEENERLKKAFVGTPLVPVHELEEAMKENETLRIEHGILVANLKLRVAMGHLQCDYEQYGCNCGYEKSKEALSQITL